MSCVDEPFKQLSLRSRSQWRVTSLQQQYGGMAPEKVRNLFSLYYSDDADLVLFWSIPGSSDGAGDSSTSAPPTVRRGHQYIMGINLSLQSPLQEIQAKFSGRNMEGIASKALYAATVREKKALVSSLVKSRTKEISPLRIMLRSSEDYYHNFGTSG